MLDTAVIKNLTLSLLCVAFMCLYLTNVALVGQLYVASNVVMIFLNKMASVTGAAIAADSRVPLSPPANTRLLENVC